MSFENMLTSQQAAEMLDRATTTLAQWRARGIGPKFHKMGYQVFYKQDDLEAYMKTAIHQKGNKVVKQLRKKKFQ